MKKVLIIENEANLRKLVSANLAVSGWQVLGAADGDEGLELARHEHPDLVLLDVKMPKMSGWEVLSTMKASPELKEIPVILMTASAREVGEEKSKSLGAAGYLLKPFSVDQLLSKIREVIGR